MKKNTSALLAAFAVILLFSAGCLVSGTFIIWETIDFNPFQTTATFYPGSIDLTENEDWQEHEEDIDRVETVGFEIWMTNNGSTEVILNGYIDDPHTPLLSESQVPDSAWHIIVDLPVPGNASGRVVKYEDSFQYLDHVNQLIRLTGEGAFDYYGLLSGSASGVIDSIKVIVTLNASDS